MERLPKYYLSFVLIFLLISCSKGSRKSNREKAENIYAEAIKHYQGTAAFQNGIINAIKVDSTYDDAIRELSIAYLKRGIPHEWKKRIDLAVELNPAIWQGYRGYNYLWFYRDYKKAIADFNASDTLNPTFIDRPQGHSVDYWRGIAYLGLKDYKNSIEYFDKYIQMEIDESGEDWVELTAFLYRGIAQFESGNYEEALINFDKQLKYARNLSADAKYYKAKILNVQGKNDVALKLIIGAIDDYNSGYYNNRPYVETLRQIYPEDLDLLKDKIINDINLK